MGAWDTTCCGPVKGGVWWDTQHTQKATASNFGPVITAVQLFQHTNNNTYLAFAKQARTKNGESLSAQLGCDCASTTTSAQASSGIDAHIHTRTRARARSFLPPHAEVILCCHAHGPWCIVATQVYTFWWTTMANTTSGQIADHINAPSGDLVWWSFTYNQVRC